jgi:hypothetical protein
MSAIIHINDNNILVHKGDRAIRSQGYAWLSGAQVYFDLDAQNNAVKHCRLEPQQINSSYWQQCAQTSITSNQSGMRHAADLIWRHLGELQTTQALSEVKLVVPSHYQAANLQLLLGICKASNLQVNGVVNKAVIALQQNISQAGHYLHIDVQLHQTVCSEVIAKVNSSGVASVVLGEIEILHEIGLQAMQDALLRGIQQRFILSDRFDPLHYAETEQQLFDQLPALASALRAQGTANISVDYQGRQHATSIDLKQWNSALEPYAQQLDTVLINAPVDHRYYDFNGFQALSFSNDKQTSIDQNKAVLMAQAAVLNALTSSELTDDADKIIYRTELRLELDQALSTTEQQDELLVSSAPVAPSQDENQQADSNSNQGEDAPTHLLQAGQAIQLGNAQIELDGRQIKLQYGPSSNLTELLESGKLFILGDTSRNQLRVDDRLGSELADGVITLIKVLHGSTLEGD